MLAGAVAVSLTAGIAWAAGDWSAAKDKVHELKSKQAEVRKLAVEETRKLVGEICAASDEDRKSVARNASSNASSRLGYPYREAERAQRDAIDLLERVLSDDSLKEHHDDARSFERELRSRWDKLEDQTRDLRDGRHPVVSHMLDRGEDARRDRIGRCTTRDVEVGYHRADCITAQWDTCTVVSVTSDSRASVRAGRDRADRVRSELERELRNPSSDVLKRLIDRNPDLAKCKRFESRVDCYHLCPDVDDEGRVREGYPSWQEGCS
jgi:hypothetical protein